MTRLLRLVIVLLAIITGGAMLAACASSDTKRDAQASEDPSGEPTPRDDATPEEVAALTAETVATPAPPTPTPAPPTPTPTVVPITARPCSEWSEDPDETSCFSFEVPEHGDTWTTVNLSVTIHGVAIEDLPSSEVEPILVIGDNSLTWNPADLLASLPSAPIVQVSTRGYGVSEPLLTCPEVTVEILGAASACRNRLQRVQIDATRYAPPDIARDVERLRMALGLDQWSIVVASEARVDRMALAEELLTTQSESITLLSLRQAIGPPASLSERVQFLDAHAVAIVEACDAQAGCQDEYPNLRDDLRAMLSGDVLTAQSIDQIAGGFREDETSRPTDFVLALAGKLGSSDLAPLLPALAVEARSGSGELLDELFWWPLAPALPDLVDDCRSLARDDTVDLTYVDPSVLRAIDEDLASLCADLRAVEFDDASETTEQRVDAQADDVAVVVHLPHEQVRRPAEQAAIDRHSGWTVLHSPVGQTPECIKHLEAPLWSDEAAERPASSESCNPRDAVWIRTEPALNLIPFSYVDDYDDATLTGVHPMEWQQATGWTTWQRFDHALDITEFSIDWWPGFTTDEALTEIAYEWSDGELGSASTTHETSDRVWTLRSLAWSDHHELTSAIALFDDTPVSVTLKSTTREKADLIDRVLLPVLDDLTFAPG